jgi:hypothetical protein
MGIASGAAASPVAYLSDWSITVAVQGNDVTAFGDPNKIYVAGLPDISGDFAGFYDDSSRQFYTAARDGQPRNFYLYPDMVDDPNQFWFGQMLPDFDVSGGIGGSVNVKATWKPFSAIRLSISGNVLDEASANITDEAGAALSDEGGYLM